MRTINGKHEELAVTEIAPQSECVARCLISIEIGGRKFTADMKVWCFNLSQKNCAHFPTAFCRKIVLGTWAKLTQTYIFFFKFFVSNFLSINPLFTVCCVLSFGFQTVSVANYYFDGSFEDTLSIRRKLIRNAPTPHMIDILISK